VPDTDSAAYSLQRWLAACRVAMLTNPLLGAVQVEHLAGNPAYSVRPGWTKTWRFDATGKENPSYIQIAGPQDPGPPGRTTGTPPPDVPEARLREVVPPSRIEDTRLWRLLGSTADDAIRAGLETAEHRDLVLDQIRQSARRDTSDILRLRFGLAMTMMRSTLAYSRRYPGEVDPDDIFVPARALVRAFLSFEISGMIAREVLAVVLSTQRQVPQLGPPQQTPPDARDETIDHLFSLAQQIVSGAQDADVPSFNEMHYLAELYADTAQTLAGHALELAGSGSPQRRRYSGLVKNIEEWTAYHVRPSFLPPLLSSPGQILDWIEARTPADGSLADTARSMVVHPTLARLVTAPQAWRDLSPEALLHSYLDPTGTTRSHDVRSAVDGELDPVSPAARTEVADRLRVT
jgi:hypothetical protein